MKDMGPLHHFLGLSVTRQDDGFHLSQRWFILEILERAGMADCKPCSTPVDISTKLSGTEGVPVSDPTHYRGLTGALQYLTWPSITYAVQQVCLHMRDPREPHYAIIKRILRYVHAPSSPLWLRTLMLIGLDARTLSALHPDMEFFLATVWCHGL